MNISRRVLLQSLIATGFAASMGSASRAQQGDVIKIGYAASLTGPNAGGALTMTKPNYEFWVHEINKAGGLLLGGKRYPVELIVYDDRSISEEAVRAVERLVTQDKVDIVLPPWGTALNLAVGPLFNKYGFPQVTSTSITDRQPDLAKRWPMSFLLTGTATSYAESLVEVLVEAREQGKIDDKVAMVSVSDAFGIDQAAAARKAFARHNFTLTYDRSYPVATQDFSSILAEVKDSKVFIAFSYPPDTVAITEQAQLHRFNPDIFYVGVGGPFPMYRERFGASIEGVITQGGINFESELQREYLKAHTEVIGKEPDHSGMIVQHAGLQAYQQAIERVGSLDFPAIAEVLKTSTFQTVLGEVTLHDQTMSGTFKTGQYRNGVVVGLSPRKNPGAADPVIPKPAWPER